MFSRHLVNAITESQADTPVLLLHGARQTGKSTLMRALAGGDARYLSLDDASLLSALRADPAGYLAANPGRLLIDEVQRAPDVFLAIKHEVDLARMARKPVNGRFLLSGSANVLLLPRLADSLAGRMEVHTLWPLSQSEVRGGPGRVAVNFLDAVFAPEPPAAAHNGVRGPIDIDAMGRDELITQLLTGGYPEVVARSSEKRRKAWFDAYLHTIVQRGHRHAQYRRPVAHFGHCTDHTAPLPAIAGDRVSAHTLAGLGAARKPSRPEVPQAVFQRQRPVGPFAGPVRTAARVCARSAGRIAGDFCACRAAKVAWLG